MTRCFIIVFFALSIASANAQNVAIVKLKDLQDRMEAKSDKIQVINFWATWCGPCIKELPLFEQMNEMRDDVAVSLVSIDLDLDPNPDKVHRFVARKKLKSDVLILDAIDPNSWIDKIDESWSGAIPATLVINTASGKRKFVQRELKEGDLDELINSVKQ